MDYIFSESWIKQMKLDQSSFYTLKWCLHMLLNLECSKDDFLLVNSTQTKFGPTEFLCERGSADWLEKMKVSWACTFQRKSWAN